jgi:hypothetical protein
VPSTASTVAVERPAIEASSVPFRVHTQPMGARSVGLLFQTTSPSSHVPPVVVGPGLAAPAEWLVSDVDPSPLESGAGDP